MKDNQKELFRLMKEYPDLPVIPLVCTEVVGDDSASHYAGSIGKARVDEYLFGKEWLHFKSKENIVDTLKDCMDYKGLETLPNTDDVCRMYFDKLPWKKAIIVYIELPDEN